MINRIPTLAIPFVVGLLSLILVTVPLNDFIQHLYSWQFHQPGFVQGGMELLAIAFILFVFGFVKSKKCNYILLIVITEGYLRRHNADVALLLAFLFAESLIGLGNIFFKGTLTYKIPTFFISGSSLFVVISMGLSLFELAKMVPLIAFSFIVAVHFYVTAYRESLLYKLSRAVRYLYCCDHLSRWVSLLLYICFLMLSAKTAYKLNYDEAWYSLRLSEVLNANGNHFEDLKLLGNWVHQYPKFFEVLIFPLQYFESYTLSKIFSVIVLGISLIAAHEFWQGYHLSARQRVLMSVVLISIPVVAGDSTSAKADFFAGFVFLLSVLYFLKGFNERNNGFLLISMGLLVLTLAIKLSSIGYVLVFIAIYIYATFQLRGELLQANRKQVAVTTLFIAAFCVITWRTFELTGVPFVGIADLSPSIAFLYGLLGMEYIYPYGPVSTFADAAKIDSLTLLINTFLFPTVVRQSITWISNISIPFVVMAVFWFLKFKHGKYETLLIVLSGIIMISVIGLVFNNTGIKGGDGNYYLIPMMVIVVVGAAAFKLMPEYTLSIELLCSIYIMANLPIAFVSSQSWHVGTRGLDLVFNSSPFNRNDIRDKLLKANGLLDVRDHFAKLDQRKCVAIAEGGNDSLYYLSCRLETAQTILGSRPYLNAKEDLFVSMLKEKGVTHLVVQNYFPNNYFGRFCRLLMDHVDAQVSRFEFYDVIDIRDINDNELKHIAVSATTSIDDMNSENLIANTKNSVKGGVSKASNNVNFNPPRSGIRKYYSSGDNVIFISSDTTIDFFVDTKGRCVNSIEGYVSKQIHSSGQKIEGGKFTLTIFSEGKKLNEEIYNIDSISSINSKIKLNEHQRVIKIVMKYESDGGRSNTKIPTVIINPLVRYCD